MNIQSCNQEQSKGGKTKEDRTKNSLKQMRKRFEGLWMDSKLIKDQARYDREFNLKKAKQLKILNWQQSNKRRTSDCPIVCFPKSNFQQNIKGIPSRIHSGHIEFRSKSCFLLPWDKSKGSQHFYIVDFHSAFTWPGRE